MNTNTYTEEEFKKLLKGLFAEKKRVKELQKQLENRDVQKKFESKLTDIHQASLTQEIEIETYKNQLEKVKPALKKLVEDLRQAREEIDKLHAENLEAKALICTLEEEKGLLAQSTNEFKTTQQEWSRLQVILENERQEKKALEEEKNQLKKVLASKQDDLQEAGRIEAERTRLVERLADCLSQMQRQTEIIKELQDELSQGRRQFDMADKERQIYFEQSQEAKQAFCQLQEKWEKTDARAQELEKVQLELALLKKELQMSDLVSVRQEAQIALAEKEAVLEKMYEQMREQSIRYAALMEDHEKRQGSLAKMEKEFSSLQTTLQNAKLLCEEREAEIRKAQQHLAKKVKEATILRDLSERQKMEIQDLQNERDLLKSEIETMQSHLYLQKHQEDQLKAQMNDLQKMRKQYEQMSMTFSNLKNLIGNTLPEGGGPTHV